MAVKSGPSRRIQQHPEAPQHYDLARALQKIYESLTGPEIKLPVVFPWNAKQFGRIYFTALLYYLAGSFIPLFIMIGGLFVAATTAPLAVIAIASTPQGHPNMALVLGTTIVSFFCGFGAELWYICHEVRQAGLRWQDAVALNLRSLEGSWAKAFKYAFVALAIGLLIQVLLTYIPMPQPNQAVADLARKSSGVPLLGFFILAGILAPFFEEIIFRGYLFNALRAVLRQGKLFKWMHESNHFADYAAVITSAIFFAAAHLDPSAFLHLFALGVILAEVYRRSGSLVCPILVHSLNNLLATMLLILGKAP